MAPAAAQNTVEREVKVVSGKEARVGVYTDIRPDCSSGPLPAIRLVVRPAHGAVNVKRGKLNVTNFKQCLAVQVPVLVAFYRPADAFSGTDEFVLEIGLANGRKELQHFHVQVTNGAGGGKSI